MPKRKITEWTRQTSVEALIRERARIQRKLARIECAIGDLTTEPPSPAAEPGGAIDGLLTAISTAYVSPPGPIAPAMYPTPPPRKQPTHTWARGPADPAEATEPEPEPEPVEQVGRIVIPDPAGIPEHPIVPARANRPKRS